MDPTVHLTPTAQGHVWNQTNDLTEGSVRLKKRLFSLMQFKNTRVYKGRFKWNMLQSRGVTEEPCHLHHASLSRWNVNTPSWHSSVIGNPGAKYEMKRKKKRLQLTFCEALMGSKQSGEKRERGLRRREGEARAPSWHVLMFVGGSVAVLDF